MTQTLSAHSYVVANRATGLGYVAVAVAAGALRGVTFAHASAHASARRVALICGCLDRGRPSAEADPRDVELADDLVDRLHRYLEGEPVDFSKVAVDGSHLSAFQQRVVAACRAIPRGVTRTYGELAAAVGSPGAARAVGQVMAANRTPLVVPCHRVVASGGALGGFSAPQGIVMKRRLLDLETDGTALAARSIRPAARRQLRLA